MECMVHVIVQQDVHVIKVEIASVQVKPDHVCVDQTAHVVLMEHVNVHQDVIVQKMEHVFVLVKQELVCVDQTAHVATK